MLPVGVHTNDFDIWCLPNSKAAVERYPEHEMVRDFIFLEVGFIGSDLFRISRAVNRKNEKSLDIMNET